MIVLGTFHELWRHQNKEHLVVEFSCRGLNWSLLVTFSLERNSVNCSKALWPTEYWRTFREIDFIVSCFILLWRSSSFIFSLGSDGLKYSAALTTTYPSGHLPVIFSRTAVTNFCAPHLNPEKFSIHYILEIYQLTLKSKAS